MNNEASYSADGILADAFSALEVTDRPVSCGFCGARFATVVEEIGHRDENDVCTSVAPISDQLLKKFSTLEIEAEQARHARNSYFNSPGSVTDYVLSARRQAMIKRQAMFDEAWGALTMQELRQFGEWRKTR